MNRKPG